MYAACVHAWLAILHACMQRMLDGGHDFQKVPMTMKILHG